MAGALSTRGGRGKQGSHGPRWNFEAKSFFPKRIREPRVPTGAAAPSLVVAVWRLEAGLCWLALAVLLTKMRMSLAKLAVAVARRIEMATRRRGGGQRFFCM